MMKQFKEFIEQAPVAPAPGVHRIAVTVSEPDHPMVSKRKELQQKFVRVTHAGDKESAIARGKKHFAKKGFKVHDAEHVGMVHEASDMCNVCGQTPCNCTHINELSSETLQRYKDKARTSADELTAAGKHKKAADRWRGHMKATGKQIEKTTSAIKQALK